MRKFLLLMVYVAVLGFFDWHFFRAILAGRFMPTVTTIFVGLVALTTASIIFLIVGFFRFGPRYRNVLRVRRFGDPELWLRGHYKA